MGEGREQIAGDPEGLRWLYGFLWPERGRIIVLVLLSAAATALALSQPWLTKLIIDDGLLAGDFRALLTWSSGLLILGVASTALSGYNRIKHTRLSGNILFALREDVYEHLQKLGPGFFSRERSGDLISRMNRDISEIQRFAVDTLFSAFSGVIGLVGTCTMMLLISWQLSLILLFIVPLELIYLVKMRPLVEQRNRQLRERGADITAFFTEKVPAIKFIQSAGAEQRELGRLSALNGIFLGDLVSLQKTEFWTAAIPGLLLTAGRAGVFVLGGYWVIQGGMQVGSLIAFGAYLGMATGPVQSLLGLYMAWQRLRVSLERVSYLRRQPLPAATGTGRTPPEDLDGELILDDLRFSYPEGPEIFSGANMTIPAGTRVGILGDSGIGKSTLLDLLQLHLHPRGGRILVDGHDIAEFDPRLWRARIAVVPQDPVIFRDSLANNVRYSVPNASNEEIVEACSRAGLDSLVEKLPQGIDTIVSERGASLSGGERQRIALARALLQKPVVLLLDEPTSAVDPEAELVLVGQIEHLFAGTTQLIVSHRPSALANAELLLAVENGKLVAQSSPAARRRHAG
ncbi:MAG: ATP-binding cassette domain-containing protein [Haliea sp.]|jgi:ATP-binding cassette subfamily B protein|nr:ATP-binding cassette domain-containing protein [Haliea sp.]